jgi:hypothetical protein
MWWRGAVLITTIDLCVFYAPHLSYALSLSAEGSRRPWSVGDYGIPLLEWPGSTCHFLSLVPSIAKWDFDNEHQGCSKRTSRVLSSSWKPPSISARREMYLRIRGVAGHLVPSAVSCRFWT